MEFEEMTNRNNTQKWIKKTTFYRLCFDEMWWKLSFHMFLVNVIM